MTYIHIILPIRFDLSIFLAPDLPVYTRRLTIPPLRDKIFFFMFFKINKAHKDSAIRSNIFHGHVNQEFNVLVMWIHWILAVYDAMFIAVVALSHDSAIFAFNFQGLGGPFGVELVVLIMITDKLIISTLTHKLFGCRYLPIIKFSIERAFVFWDLSPHKMDQIPISSVVLLKRWLESSS